MTSLYARATPRQAIVLRMIEGACRNTMHAHPGQILDERLARSISKRAAGTLTAGWPTVLAAPRAWSEGASGQPLDQSATGANTLGLRSDRVVARSANGSKRGASQVRWRTPLVLLHRALVAGVGPAKRSGQMERAEALIDVMRLLSAVMALPDAPRSYKQLASMGFINKPNVTPTEKT